MKKAQQSWVKHRHTPSFNVGDQVWLEGSHLRTNQPTTKLAPRRHGPFKITKVMSRLELPTQWSIHPVFHIDLLTPYRETLTHGPNYQRPPPDLVEGEEEYKVKKILDSWRFGRRRRLQYLIKWKGYPDSENQWVNKEDAHADEAIAEFENASQYGKGSYIRSMRCEGESPPPLHPFMTTPTEQTPLLSTPPITRPTTPVILAKSHGSPSLTNPFCGPTVSTTHPVEADTSDTALASDDTIDNPFRGTFDNLPITLVTTYAGVSLDLHDPSEDMSGDEVVRAAAAVETRTHYGPKDEHHRDLALYALYCVATSYRGPPLAKHQQCLDEVAGGLRPITQQEVDHLLERFPRPPLARLSPNDQQPERYVSLQAPAAIRGSGTREQEAENVALCAVLPLREAISPAPLRIQPHGATLMGRDESDDGRLGGGTCVASSDLESNALEDEGVPIGRPLRSTMVAPARPRAHTPVRYRRPRQDQEIVVDLFPAEHPSIHTAQDTNNPQETLYACYANSNPIVRTEHIAVEAADPNDMMLWCRNHRSEPPFRYHANTQEHFVPFL